MSIPKIGANSGSFINYQSGWKYDLIKTNGEVKGNIRELLSQWLYADSGAAKELSDIIRELAYGNPSNERKQELYNQFEANEEFRRAKILGLVSNKASIEKLANGLTGIWKYVEIDETAPKKIQEVDKRESIDSWFEKLYNDYSTISQIAKGREVNMTVSTLSEGEMITINPDEALPASKALAGGVNTDTHKVIIGNPRVQNDVIVSGKGHTSGINIGQGNTAVLLPTLGGKIRFAHAYPSEVTDEHLGQDVKEIVQTLQDEIFRLVDNFTTNPSNESYKELYNFVESVIGNGRGISTLFTGLIFDPYIQNGEIINFGIKINKDTELKFYRKSKNGGFSTRLQIRNPEFGSKTVSLTSKDAKTAISEMLNNLSFWVDASYLDSDNVANKPLNGIGSRSNGKFIIKIGDKTWTYDSYNEFLLKNDILKLTTKPNEDGTSNFRKRGEISQRNNAQLKVTITDKTTSPVESNETGSTEQTTQPVAGLSISQKVTNILNSNSENKGIEIVKSVLGTIPNIDENVIKSFKDLNILPKSIIFDENFNVIGSRTEKINASVNRSTGVVTVGNQWLDLFNNPNTRGRAIRILIHEQLHNKLRKNHGYVRSAQSIYDEFKSALENGTIKGNRNSEELNHLKEYLFEKYEDKDKALEEFLVESLTNEELARALNDIDAVVPTKRGKNLFQKILELMSKVFSWDIRKGSLYEKELKTLRDLSRTTNKSGKTSTTTINNKNNKYVQLSLFENENDTFEESETKDKIDENYKQQQTTEEIEKPIDVTEEVKEDISIEDEFAQFEDDGSFDDFDSSVTEMTSKQENAYISEMQSIKEKAIADGTFMKAPNGKPTNLNERQWLQVRTKAFKDWFGDWKNNPANASKIVDENGEPLVVYHRTPSKFNEFRDKYNNYNSKGGFYFASKNTLDFGFETSGIIAKAEIEGIQLYDMPLFINMRNPGEYSEDPRYLEEEYDGGFAKFGTEEVSLEDFPDDINKRSILSKEEYNVYQQNRLKELQKDKYILSGFVRNSNQIKSATDNIGTFSTTNDDIRYSSVTELPSIPAFAERLPVAQQARFDSLVASAEISTYCR